MARVPTSENTAARTDRFSTIGRLLQARSVAIVGASDDPSRIGGRPVAAMLSQGFAGRIFPVNPRRTTVQGLRAYPSIADLPEVPDVAVIAIPPKPAVDVVRASALSGVAAAIVFTSGFAEVGGAGTEEQARLTDVARGSSMRVLGPNCLGCFNARIGFYPTFSTSFEGGWPRQGRIAIASQSGAYGTHIFGAARNRGMGTPICVMTGNEADVTLGEVIGWLAGDPDTDVILAYIEGIRDVDSLLAGLDAARANGKPVMMLRAGRTAIGRLAADAHTASPVANGEIVSSIFREHGVVEARTIEELLDFAYAATRRIYPAANTLGVLSISGGAGAFVADLASSIGLPMPPLPSELQHELKSLQPLAGTRNPVDCSGQSINTPEIVGRFIEAVVNDGQYSSVLAYFAHTAATASFAPYLREQLALNAEKHPEILLALAVLAPDRINDYEQAGYLVFEDPARALMAVYAMGLLGRSFARGDRMPAPLVAPLDVAVEAADEVPARLLAAIGIEPLPTFEPALAGDAITAAQSLGRPVLLRDAGRPGVWILPQGEKYVECVIGVERDPLFGHVAFARLRTGGGASQRRTQHARCPFGEDVAAEMLDAACRPFLTDEYEGWCASPVLVSALARLSVVACQSSARLRSIAIDVIGSVRAGERVHASNVSITLQPEAAEPSAVVS